MTATTRPGITLDEQIEAAYWRFDARRKGYSDWKGAPMSERDAFKAECRDLKRIRDIKDVPEPVAEVIDFDQGFKFGPQRKVNFLRFGEPLPPAGTLLYGPEVLDLLAAERERTRVEKKAADHWFEEANNEHNKLAKVMEALREVCYSPGSGQFSHINYCRWCHYAENHPHDKDCIMSAALLDVVGKTQEVAQDKSGEQR